MPIEKTLESDFIHAMKAKDSLKVSVLRMLKAALSNHKIQKKSDSLEDEEVLDIIRKQVKQRKESLESFEKGGRKDLAEKERLEMNLLLAYLPAQLSDEEIKAEAKKAIAACAAQTKAEAGKVMKVLMPALKGKADGKRINEILMALLP